MKRSIYYLLAMLIAQSSTLLIGMDSPKTPKPPTPRTPMTPSPKDRLQRTRESFPYIKELENITAVQLQTMADVHAKKQASESSSSLPTTTNTINQASSVPLPPSAAQQTSTHQTFEKPDGDDEIKAISDVFEEKIGDTTKPFTNVDLSDTSKKSFSARCLIFFGRREKK